MNVTKELCFSGEIDHHKIGIIISIILPRIITLFDMFSEDVDCIKVLLEMLISVSDQGVIIEYRTVSYKINTLISSE